MSAVTVSPKYQVVIPKEIRESLKITPGQRMQVIAYEGRIELVAIKPLKRMRGFLKGIDTEVPRAGDRDL
jgi:AbrB family looped-hinge helix DNA binding protein